MKISAKTEYACIAVLELAACFQSQQIVRIGEIAAKHRIPPRFLVQILLQLKGAGLVASTRGAAGGYRLLRSPEEISVGEVIGVMECRRSLRAARRGETSFVRTLHHIWAEAAQTEQDLLDGITLAELLERSRLQSEPMYYI